MKINIKKKKLNLIAAKLNIHGNIFGTNVPDLIKKIPPAIRNASYTEDCIVTNGLWNWRIILDDEKNSFLLGRLCKARNETTEVLKGTSVGDFEIPTKVYYSFFLYEPKEEILIFEENSNISKHQFAENFDLILQRIDYVIGQVVIVPYPKKNEYRNLLRKALQVTALEFEIIPPNFKKRKSYKNIHEIIADQKSKKLNVKFENEDGVNIEGDFVDEGFSLLEEGYVPESRAVIINREGNSEIISSNTMINQREFKLKEGNINEVFRLLKIMFNNAKPRIDTNE
ncbi:hypothetical protein AWH56_002130 [Anaerobacillus isosaccharinicus]|uniref:DUF4747 domain-containing protein n=1 Tax=Anaerobacillus isosaccharinicus TaxID=1532552 RepID=A0A1S2LMV2_9BACI|nr:hypothetical protein [Anaerobacillus isosaccharinicus]MBA5585152.1 hypothetical protein [Anaerobacillus isosaccharinicus]QOY36507.1 hypothetical protein AWH56_002130 [Anaerobacillus isosaccharinicus]